jgi:hypothetical protein
MFLVCHKEELVRRTFEAVVRAAERDRRFAKRVQESCARVLRFKKRASELKRVAPVPTEAIVRRLRDQIAAFRAAIEGNA